MARNFDLFESEIKINTPNIGSIKTDVDGLSKSLESIYPKEVERRTAKNITQTVKQVDLIRSAISRLPNQTSPGVKALQRQFQEINKTSSKNFGPLFERVALQAESASRDSENALERIREESALTTKSISELPKIVGSNLSLAFGEGGSKALVLQKGLNALGLEGTLVGKALGFFTKDLDSASVAQTKLQQFTEATLTSFREFTQEQKTQIRIVKDLGKQYGVSSAALNQLDQGSTALTKSQAKLERELQRTGKISTGTLLEVENNIKRQRKEIQLLRDSLGDAIPPEFEQQLRDQEKALDRMSLGYREANVRSRQLNEELKNTDQASDKATKEISELGREVDKYSEKTRNATKASTDFTNLLLAGITGGVAFNLADNINFDFTSLSADVDEASRNLVASLGLPIEQIDRFNDIVTEVYGNNYGQSVQDIEQATLIATQTIQKFGDVTEEAIVNATQKSIALQDSFGKDYRETFGAAEALVKNFGVTFDQAFDFITKGLQDGIDVNGDFLDTIAEYSTQFRDGQLSVEEFYSLIATGAQQGTLGTDRAADLFKEFTNRVLDGSDGVSEALEHLGFNAENVFARLRSGAATEGEIFQEVLDALSKLNPETVDVATVVGLLGTQFEDLGTIATQELSTVAFTMDDINGATESLETRYTSLGGLAAGVGRRLAVSFKPVSDALLRIGNRLFPLIEQGIDSLLGPIQRATDGIETFVDIFFTGLDEGASVADSFGVAVNFALENINDILSDFVNGGADWALDWAIEVANGLIDGANTVIWDAATFVGDVISGFFEPGSPPKEGPLSTIDKWGRGLLDTFSDGFDRVNTGPISKALDPVRGTFDRAFEGIDKTAQDVLTNTLSDISASLIQTGTVGEENFSKISEALGEANKPLSDFINGNLKLQEQERNLSNIEQELFRARVRGEDTTEIENRLGKAREELKLNQRNLAQQKDILDVRRQERGPSTRTQQKTLEEELKAIQDRVEIGLLTEEEGQRQRVGIIKRFSEQALEAGDIDLAASLAGQARDIEDALEEQSDIRQGQSEKTLEEELSTLDEQLSLGLIDQEEAERKRVGILRKFAEQERKNRNLDRARDLAGQAQQLEDQIELRRQNERDALKAEKEERRATEKAERERRKRAEMKTAEQIRSEALDILDRQFADGIISEQEYVNQRLRIEQKYYNDLLEEGKEVPDQLIEDIKGYQALIDEFRNKNKKGEPIVPKPVAADTFDDFEDDTDNIFDRIVDNVSEKFTDKLNINEDLQNNIGKFFTNISNLSDKLGLQKFAIFTDNLVFIKEIIKGDGITGFLLGKVGLLTPLQKVIDILGRFSGITFIFEKLSGIAGTLASKLGPLTPLLKKLAGRFSFLLGPVGILISVWANWNIIIAILDEVRNAFNSFVDRFGGWENLVATFDETWQNLQETFITIKDTFLNVVDALFGGDLSGAFIALTEGLENINLQPLQDNLSIIFTNLWNAVIFDTIAPLISELGTRIRDMLPPNVQAFLDGILERLSTFKSFITDTIIPAINSFRDGFNTGLSPSIQGIIDKLTEFRVDVQPQIDAILIRAKELWDELTESVGEIVTTFQEKMGPVLDKLAERFGIATGEGGGFNETLGAIVGFILDVGLEFILTKISQALDGIIIAMDLLNLTIQAITPIVQIIIEAWALFSNTLILVQEGIVIFKDFIFTTFQEIFDFLVGNSIIPNLITQIIFWWDLLFTDIPTKIQTFIDGIKTKFEELKMNVTGKMTDIQTELSNIASSFFQIGQDMMNFLLDGLESAWENVTSFLDTAVDTISGSFDFNVDFPSLPGFATGIMEVPNDMVAQIHKGEMILPQAIAEPIRDFLGNTGGGIPTSNTNNQLNVPVSITVNGTMDVDQAEQIGQTIGRTAQQELRSRGF